MVYTHSMNINKRELISRLVKLQAPGDAAEQRRLTNYHRTRNAEDILDTLGRLNHRPTAAEIRRHCQFESL